MTAKPLHDELAALEQAATDAFSVHEKARNRQRREFHYAARDAVAGLVSLRDSILHKKPDAPELEERDAREREESIAFAEHIIASEDLVLFPLGTSDSISVRDLSCDRDAKTSNIAAVVARKKVRDFQEANGEKLAQEVADEEMAKIRESLKGNDPAKVRAVLAGKV